MFLGRGKVFGTLEETLMRVQNRCNIGETLKRESVNWSLIRTPGLIGPPIMDANILPSFRLNFVIGDRSMHNVCIDKAEAWVLKRGWDRSDDREAETLPKLYCTFIAADDAVELHSLVAQLARKTKGVMTKRSCDAAALREWTCYISAVGNVAATTALIGSHIISANDHPLERRDKDPMVWRGPISECCFTGHVA